MVQKIDPYVVGRIVEAYQYSRSPTKVQSRLAEDNIHVSLSTIKRYAKEHREKTSGKVIQKKTAWKRGRPFRRTKAFVNKVRKALECRNPDSQRLLSKKYKCAKGTIYRTARLDLGLKWKKKASVHKLNVRQAAQRLQRAPRFRKWLSKRKLPYIVTLDECWVSTNHTTGERDGYYENAENPVPDEYRKKEVSGWPTKILCAMGVSLRGKTGMYVIPNNAKINAEVFLKHVLQPMWKTDIPRLYGKEAKKVILHMDAAPGHFGPIVINWLEKNKIQYIPKEH